MVECLGADEGGQAIQADAAVQQISANKIVSTDPPYYDNIGYADLSDFFYVWLRKSLRSIFPELFGTLAVPKVEELVATPYRHGGRKKAETFFLDGMSRAVRGLAEQAHPAFPVTIYYAFKQSETKDRCRNGRAPAGRRSWTRLSRPDSRLPALGRCAPNSLATCMRGMLLQRPRFQYRPGLPPAFCKMHPWLPVVNSSARSRPSCLPALAHLQRGNIAPVDLAQAAIGPGMAVYTRYAKVLDTHGESCARARRPGADQPDP